LKGGSCQVCKFDEYEGALEFHHVDPATKDDKLSKMTRSKLSKEIIDEINKCVLVCSVCHKMIHAGLRACPSPACISYDVLK
jgi:predicted HNH restriction endonuclease